jgi:hypothetical protein
MDGCMHVYMISTLPCSSSSSSSSSAAAASVSAKGQDDSPKKGKPTSDTLELSLPISCYS